MKFMNPVIVVIALYLPLTVAAHEGAAHKSTRKPAAQPEEKAFGRSAEGRKATRVIKVDMSDTMRFTPGSLAIRQGETVQFVITNSGKTLHEMVLGTLSDLKEHAELMRKFPKMEHDEPYMTHVAPGRTERMLWQFTKPGEFYYGCLVPGHFEAGMMGRITVSAAAKR
jgi:uncharacterized cupredoxin-like copper-binding protein